MTKGRLVSSGCVATPRTRFDRGPRESSSRAVETGRPRATRCRTGYKPSPQVKRVLQQVLETKPVYLPAALLALVGRVRFGRVRGARRWPCASAVGGRTARGGVARPGKKRGSQYFPRTAGQLAAAVVPATMTRSGQVRFVPNVAPSPSVCKAGAGATPCR